MRAFLSVCLPKIQRWEGIRGQNATLECNPVSGDFEYDDEYTPTIDDNLTDGKVVMSSLSAHDRKSQLDALVCHQAALL